MIFDYPSDSKTAAVKILPVPYDATTSYGDGTRRGPQAILRESVQIDLCDPDVGHAALAGIFFEESAPAIAERNMRAKACVDRVRTALRDEKSPNPSDLATVNQASANNNTFVYDWAKETLKQNQMPVVLGGDHSVPFGNIKACAEAFAQEGGISVLHIDAHADLRNAYQGFTDSHASIMYNVVSKIPDVKRLIQVGIRDFCKEELDLITNSNGRIITFFDKHLRDRKHAGNFAETCAHIAYNLGPNVYLSFDIDGLDPVLCPHTGTPVPGGLSFDHMITLLEAVVSSGRRIVGADLVEVAGEVWDANVGARVLYKILGFALLSRKHPTVIPPTLPVPSGF